MNSNIAACAALFGATSAVAQTAQGATSDNQQTQTIVVTASRSGDPQDTDLLGTSATVVQDEDLRDRQVRLVSDVLRDVPGVAVSRAGAAGGFTQVRLHGAEANQTLVLIDGIKASDPFLGEFDFGTLAADEGVRIEVLRGQQSALYGSDAIGGVINYVTLTGSEAPGLRLRAEGGSFGSYSGGARIAGVAGDFDYAASGTYLRSRGYPVAIGGTRNVGSELGSLSFKSIWTAASNVHLTAVARYSDTKADSDDQDNVFGSPTFGLTIDSPGVHYRNRALFGLLKGQLDLLDGRWTNAVTAQVADVHRTNYDVPDSFSPPAGQQIVAVSGDRGQRLKGSFESTLRFDSGNLRQRLTAALDAERESERSTVSLFGGFLGWRQTNNVGLVGEYEATLDDRLGAGVALRRDWNDRFADSTTYRAQLSYRFLKSTRIHAASGSGVKAPTFSQLFDYFAGQYIGNPKLKPEKSQGWEAGIDQSISSDRIRLGATYFNNHLTDEITTAFTANGSTSINLPGRTHQQGLELFATAALSGGWRVDAGYTYLEAPQTRNVLPLTSGFSGTDTTAQAVRRPKHVASANVSWAAGQLPFSANLTVRYTGRQNDLAFTDPSYVPALVKLRSFTLVNLDASWRIARGLQLFGRAENLLGQHYQEVFSYAGAPRAVFAGIRVAR